MATHFSFLDFPAPVRERIYAHLLAPHPDENETTINYTLKWNWLENPSNTTFGGVPQIDLCRCPREKPRTTNIKTKDHMYTRYKCHGPEVKFASGWEDLWVPSQAYANSGQINFLRPATQEELSRRPSGNILSTNKTIYEEALPVLYRGRNFLFVTGPCPRGRYQAYATQRFFAGLSLFARVHITGFSLNILPHEEDCQTEDITKAYRDLAEWVQHNLPLFQVLGLNLWHPRLTSMAKVFECLLQRNGVKIELDRGQNDGWVEEVEDVEGFRAYLSAGSRQLDHVDEAPPQGEASMDVIPGEERRLNVSRPPRRSTGKVSDWESFDNNTNEDEEWSDTLLSPASSREGGVVDGWEVL
ncbi:hypothetical protein DPSP01_007596 [Paraphaeosphaeria sporulosa]|uniref:Uncharacterized protein n=1 Tax=Paraphaeosphaeria sporulosa TaxID=1460663 RepID=A0A177C6M8_9PLEO|nr:uncharacterized protein CC84DRAFT_1166372 [Paraphaeosphaeria sporulosa]OAG02529.1 hypothetical protein CC84DRAFT_1166372 [Paraphaeosphaeria sporulosa]